MNEQRPRVEIYPDREQLTRAAAGRVAQIAADSIAAGGRFTIALAGGTTPKPVYERLAESELARCVDWRRVHVFWGDERCVPPDDAQSNYRMAREALLERVPLPPENVRRMRGEDEPHEAAALYASQLEAAFGGDAQGGGAPLQGFDLILLGMGDDGHTASLFPGSEALREQRRWVVAQETTAVPSWRITLTPVVINAAHNVLFVVSGAGKAERLREVLEGTLQTPSLPVQAIKPTRGRVTWLVDEAAAARLEKAHR